MNLRKHRIPIVKNNLKTAMGEDESLGVIISTQAANNTTCSYQQMINNAATSSPMTLDVQLTNAPPDG